MNILIIGGTRFVGRALVESALARGHHLTLFHRGQTNPDIFPDVERIQGDRDGQLENLGERSWDVVIDTCGYVPRIVTDSAAYLKDKVKRYVFISSISAYAESKALERDEDAELATMEDESSEEITGEAYGALKVLCEQAAENTMPGQVLVLRPGIVAGPYDPTNRFTYWPVRIRKGGAVLVPDDPDYTTQFIDVRDLAEFTIHLIEKQATGIYNATGPDYALKLTQILDSCKAISQSNAEFRPVSTEFLLENEVQPWMQLPLWLSEEADRALMQVSVQRAVDAGLRFRPLDETIKDTLDWYDSIKGDEQDWGAGLPAERETELLQAYGQ